MYNVFEPQKCVELFLYHFTVHKVKDCKINSLSIINIVHTTKMEFMKTAAIKISLVSMIFIFN